MRRSPPPPVTIATPLDPLRAVREDERLARRRLAESTCQLRDRHGLVEPRPRTDLDERLLAPRAELLPEQRVVAKLRMRVERQVVRDERQVGAEQRLEAPAQSPIDDGRLVSPEEAVVDEHELRVQRASALEELA